MACIQAVDLIKDYRRSHLGRTTTTRGLDGVSFCVEAGEIFGLLGLNGSGKTTTIKILLGLLRPTSGSVSVLDAPAGSSAVLSRVGYLPELPSFYRHLTAREILLLYARLSDVAHAQARVDHVIESLGLSQVAGRRLGEYSKGMLQRVGVAQSLLHDPDILIYDEPVSGLDPLAMSETRAMFLRLKEQGKTIILSSHMISEVERMCDRAVILAAGRCACPMNRDEWTAAGGLEKVFVDAVAGSSPLGPMRAP